MVRRRPIRVVKEGCNAPPSNVAKIKMIPSGSSTLDCVLGGGYALGRIVNIWGDKSTGKTLLAMEALANFFLLYPDGHAVYNETESAFDPEYATRLGIPMDKVVLADYCDTIEEVFKDIDDFFANKDNETPGIYVIDSIDAISTNDEISKDAADNNKIADKSRIVGRLLRKYRTKFKQGNTCFMLISQSRMKINAMFLGRNVTKAADKPIGFFASQIIYLATIKTLSKTVNKIKRPIGVTVKAKCDKNKVGPPFRECQFNILFSFGIDDVESSLEFLSESGFLTSDDLGERSMKSYISFINKLDDRQYAIARKNIRKKVFRAWKEIEKGFLPTRRKY